MLRLAASRSSRALASLRFVSPGVGSGARYRTVASTAASPQSSATSIPGVLAAAAEAHPLKDAAKFYGATFRAEDIAALPEDAGLPSKGIKLWTYRDVKSHVGALCAGLDESGFKAGDKIVTFLAPGSPEYVVVLLAAAEMGVTVVAVEPPSSLSAVDVDPIRAAMKKYQPKALFLWHGYQASGSTVQGDGSLVNALFPSAAVEDARGVGGFVPLSGVPMKSEEFPSIEYVVHTGSAHVRGAVAFKSFLVYNDAAPKSAGTAGSTVLIEAATGKEATQETLLKDARTIGEKLGLRSDPYEKNGKLIVKPSPSSSAAAAALAALMHGSLFISPAMVPSDDGVSAVLAGENGLVA